MPERFAGHFPALQDESEEPFTFRLISNHPKQPGELVQAFQLGGMNVWERLDPWSQRLCQERCLMKSANTSQTLRDPPSIVVKTSSRCSTFPSSDSIHFASSNPGLQASISTDNRMK